jgi:hypothetical protein
MDTPHSLWEEYLTFPRPRPAKPSQIQKECFQQWQKLHETLENYRMMSQSGQQALEEEAPHHSVSCISNKIRDCSSNKVKQAHIRRRITIVKLKLNNTSPSTANRSQFHNTCAALLKRLCSLESVSLNESN